MSIISDEINTENKENNQENKDINQINQEATPEISPEQKEREEFERFKQMQAEQKALGLVPNKNPDNKSITDIFKDKAKEYFSDYDEASKFLGMLDLNQDTWKKDDDLLLTKEAKERYVDRTFGLLNNISSKSAEKAAKEFEFSEWKMNKDFGSETLSSLKSLAEEKFCQSTGLDSDDYMRLPQAYKERMVRKIHQDHLAMLKTHTSKISEDIKDPGRAMAMDAIRKQGFLKD